MLDRATNEFPDITLRNPGKMPEPFWDGWTRLKQDYDQRLPA